MYFRVIVIFLLVINQNVAQNTYYTRGSGGNWSNPGTWSTAGCNGAPATSIPGPMDNVVICNSNSGGDVSVIVDGNFTIQDLTIGTGNNHCFLIVSSTHTLNINGDLKFNAGNANKTFKLDVGQGQVNVNGTFSLWGPWNGSSEFSIGAGTLVFNPAVNLTTNFQMIHFYDAGKVFFNNGFSCTRTQARFQTVNNAQIWFRGNYTQTTNTIDFTMGQTQFPIVYFDCIGCLINNTSRVDFGDVIIYDNAVVSTAGGGNLNITGNLILNDNSTFNVSKNIPGNVSVVRSINDVILNSGSNLNIAGSVSYIQLTGNWINNGGLLNATPPTKIRFEGIGNFVGGTSPTTFPDIQFGNTLNNVNYQINQNITCNDLIIDDDNSGRSVFINSCSVQVNNNLIIYQPQNANTNLLAINGGILNVTGNLNFVGSANFDNRIGKLLVNSGLAQINGNINWMSNNSVLSEVLEVNSGTLNIQQDLNMPYNSGVINLIGPGVINFNGNTSESLNLNNTGGVNPAQFNTVANCTVTFAKGFTNSKVPIIFASGSYQIFTGNGNITPNAPITFGNFQINSGVDVTPLGDFSVANNWINLGGTFIHNNKRVSFVGASTQYISKTGGEMFYDVTSNCTGPIVLNDNVIVLNNLTMIAGNWDVNGKILILGNGGPSSLNRTGGIIYNGEFRRYWLAGTAITSNSGNYYGLFPIGTATEYRPVQINSTVAPTTAGYIGAYHTDAFTATDGSWAANDGFGSTVQRMHDERSTLSNIGVGGGTYNLDVSFTSLSSVGTLTDMRLMPYLAAGVGTHLVAIGTVSNPTVRRTGLAITDIVKTWAVGTINKDPIAGTPLRQPYYSRKSGNWSDVTPGDGTWSIDHNTLASCDCKPTPGSLVFIKTGHVVTLDIPVTANPNGPIDYLVIENGGNLVGTQNITINYDMEVRGNGSFAPTGGTWLINRDLNITGNTNSSTSPSSVFVINRHFSMTDPAAVLTLNNAMTVYGNFMLNGLINSGNYAINLQSSAAGVNIAGTGTINANNPNPVLRVYNNRSILSGSNLNILTASDVNNAIIINGTFTITNNGTVTVKGSVNGTAGNSRWINASNSQLNITGNLMTTGLLNASANPNVVNYNGSNAPWAIIKTPSDNYHTLMISNNDNRRLNANTSVTGNLIIQDNATLSDNGLSLTGSGGLIMSNNATYIISSSTTPVPSLTGIYNITGGLIRFARGGNQNIRGLNGPAPSAYYNIEFANSGTKLLQGPILVQKNLTISGSAVLDCNLVGGNNYKITLYGDWIIDPTAQVADHFNERNTNGEVEFAGNTHQTIDWGPDNTRQFFKLTINNSDFNSGVQILRPTPTIIVKSLNFIKGYLITNSYNSSNLIIKDNAITTGASDTSCVIGSIIKEGNDAFVFPVGKRIPSLNKVMYAPIEISAPATYTSQFVAEYFPNNPGLDGYDISFHDVTIDHVSSCEYWILNRLVGTSSVSVTLSWYSPNNSEPRSCGVTSLPDLSIVRWNGSTWKDHGNGGTTGDIYNGTIKTAAPVNTFSPFTLASKKSGENPLPIHLLYFNARLVYHTVELLWETATEINNDYFIIEKSIDAQNWFPIKKVEGSGTSYTPHLYIEYDYNPVVGFNYYRLKQVDYDGTATYSNMVAVYYELNYINNFNITIYPNPVNIYQPVHILLNDEIYSEKVEVSLKDLLGKEIETKTILLEENNSHYTITFNTPVKSGIYLLIVTDGYNLLSSKKIVIE